MGALKEYVIGRIDADKVKPDRCIRCNAVLFVDELHHCNRCGSSQLGNPLAHLDPIGNPEGARIARENFKRFMDSKAELRKKNLANPKPILSTAQILSDFLKGRK